MKEEIILERNKVYFGDCLELMPKLIPNKSIDLILCDLPYQTTRAKWDRIINLPSLWNEYKRVIKDRGAIVLFAQTPFDKILGCSNLPWLRYEWIWEKTQATGFQNAKKMPMKAHENILVFYKKTPKFNPQKTQGHKPVNSFTKKIDVQNKTEIYGTSTREIVGGGATDRYPRSVQIFASDKQRNKLDGTIHPTQKPIALIEYLIKSYSDEGDLILDNACGSGQTGVAAKKLKRDFIMMDIEQRWFDLSKKRTE